MNNYCRSFQQLTIWSSILLMACTYSASMAEVTAADTSASHHDQPVVQPSHSSTQNTQASKQHADYFAQRESKSEPEPQSRPHASNPVVEQQPANHESEDHSQTDHQASASDEAQVSPTAQTRIALPTLSRDADPTETPAEPVLVAMAKPPAVAIPDASWQDTPTQDKQTSQTEPDNPWQQQQEQQQQQQKEDKRENKTQQEKQQNEQMSQDNAQQILDAFLQDERDTQEKVKKAQQQQQKRRKTDKQW